MLKQEAKLDMTFAGFFKIYVRPALDGEMQMRVDAEDSLELW